MSSYGIGSLVRITTVIKSDTGELVDPSEISLSVRLPDATVVGPYTTLTTPAVEKDSLGTFHLDFPTIMAGQHVARWDVVGPTTNEEQPFDVEMIWGDAGIISLADAKSHLKKRITDTADDAKLQGIILAATSMIEDRMGHVVPLLLTETIRPFRGVAVLHDRPVIEVLIVTSGLSGDTELPAEDAGTPGWVCSAEGVLILGASAPAVGRAIYRVGRQPIPHHFRLAAKELVAHLWRTSQLNSDGGRPQLQGDVQVDPSSNFALPYNVRQLLGLNKAQRDSPVIG